MFRLPTEGREFGPAPSSAAAGDGSRTKIRSRLTAIVKVRKRLLKVISCEFSSGSMQILLKVVNRLRRFHAESALEFGGGGRRHVKHRAFIFVRRKKWVCTSICWIANWPATMRLRTHCWLFMDAIKTRAKEGVNKLELSVDSPLLASPQGGVAVSSKNFAKPPKQTQLGWFSSLFLSENHPGLAISGCYAISY